MTLNPSPKALLTESGVRSKEQNKFLKLLGEGLSGDDLQISIYMLTLKDKETWDSFLPKSFPLKPPGFDEAYDIYRAERRPLEKSLIWKEMTKYQFPAYFEAQWKAQSENQSDLKYLGDMLAAFEAKSMLAYAAVVRQRVNEYGAI